jgi:hypothetical protein
MRKKNSLSDCGNRRTDLRSYAPSYFFGFFLADRSKVARAGSAGVSAVLPSSSFVNYSCFEKIFLLLLLLPSSLSKPTRAYWLFNYLYTGDSLRHADLHQEQHQEHFPSWESAAPGLRGEDYAGLVMRSLACSRATP